LNNIYIYGYCSFALITIQSFPHSYLITGFVTRVTRGISLVKQELFILFGHLPVFIGYVLLNLWLFVLCFTNHCLSFVLFLLAITPTFQLHSFQQVRDKPLNVFLSRYLFYMKQNQIISLTWNIGTFSSFNQNFCCILKVRWLFPKPDVHNSECISIITDWWGYQV
jgi:hypothetical protein